MAAALKAQSHADNRARLADIIFKRSGEGKSRSRRAARAIFIST